MRIGILTFHCAHNYGAVLQAYALVTYLRDNGYNAEIIDYRPKSIVGAHGTFPWSIFKRMRFKSKLKYLYHTLPYLRQRSIRAKSFQRFIGTLPLSTYKYDENSNELNGYDVVICGSDQVWNPGITQGADPFYTHTIKSEATFISYAASSELKESYISTFKNIISRFDKIAVRETAFQQLLESFNGDKTIYRVLDPVFLLAKHQWLEFATLPSHKDDYLLLYQVRRDDRVLDLARNYAEQNKLKIMELTAEASLPSRTGRIRTASVEEFVGYFANAKCVLTTSFHGTAFAAIMGKPCKTVMFDTAGDGRAKDLLQVLGIKDGLYYINKGGKLRYDGSFTASNLQAEIELSKQYLKDALT